MEINKTYHENAKTGPKKLDPESIQTCVTSPPYYRQRDYGTGKWEGGNEGCDHAFRKEKNIESSTLQGSKETTGHQRQGYAKYCGRCGAKRVDEQLGLEETPEEYVKNLVDVFHDVKTALKSDGTLWLNIADTYAGGGGASGHNENTKNGSYCTEEYGAVKTGGKTYGLKPKDLIGIPWMLAFALRADGWYLRQDIIWSKAGAGMPESVTDRCSKDHEYIFLLSKSQKYYFDAAAIKTKITDSGVQREILNVVRQKESVSPTRGNKNKKDVIKGYAHRGGGKWR